MGWTSTCDSRKDKASFIREILRDFSDSSYEIPEFSIVGNQVWAILKKEGIEDRIVLFLLSKIDGCWGYKSITEEETPFYFDCPLKYIRSTSEPQGSNLNVLGSGKSWRQLVLERASEKKQNSIKLKAGERVFLSSEKFLYPGEYTVTSCLGRKGYVINNPNIGNLRLPCKQVKLVSVVS